jgi:hypothetical protein
MYLMVEGLPRLQLGVNQAAVPGITITETNKLLLLMTEELMTS